MIKGRARIAGIVVALLPLIACGQDDEVSAPSAPGPFGNIVEDVKDLPADFPRDLIPPEYTTMNYVDMRAVGGVEGANFEAARSVDGPMQYYTKLLGEPTITVGEAGGERNSQWHKTPHERWAVSVLGSDANFIVSLSRVPER